MPVNEVPEDKRIAPAVLREYAGLEYLEFANLLPGVKHYKCEKLNSTLSVASCADRFAKANCKGPEANRYFACRSCPIGAAHSEEVAPNESRFYGKKRSAAGFIAAQRA